MIYADSVRRVSALAFLFFWLLPAFAHASPVVVELFTSEACSSCPAAEKLLAQMQKSNPNILLLSFHVTYWDGPGWRDKYSLVGATDRQDWYAGIEHSDEVYTPEAVVNGINSMIGSDATALSNAIATAQTANPVGLTLSSGQMITIKVDAGQGSAKLWLFGYDSHHTTPIGGGENSGVTVDEANVVRSITPLGAWTGVASSYTMSRPAGEHMAVLLQDDSGRLLGTAAD